MITANYRRDYAGEFIILETRFVDGKKQQTREWIENPIVNQHISGRAAVVGSNVDREQFDYCRLERHRGGLLGKKRLQTYGTGTTWDQMRFDFFVTVEPEQIEKIIADKYDESTVVYSNTKNCIAYPEHFYLVPHTPHVDQLAQAIYLAAFDGHNEIFLLGYTQETSTHSKWIAHVDQVMQAYRSVKFYLVGTESNMPAQWRQNKNTECMTYRQFVSYCDI